MDCGIITSKTVLLLLSLIFWAAGVALAYVGSYVIKSYNNFEDFVADKYSLIPAAIIIGVAVVMFVIGIIGCCATLKESKVGLGFFLLIILVIFAAEVTAFVFGFIYRGRIKGDLEKSMSDVFQKYDGLNGETHAVDYLQTQLECCGVQNYTDWTATPWYGQHNNSVPQSCCKANATQCSGLLSQPELLNTQGCESKLEQMLQGVLSYAMLVILGFAIIKLFGMFSICVITCRSRKHDYQPLYA
ncbi:tetraspanin 36 [Triplophysa rosa]|uniref:Tetraspanin n=1 Tax=Triplophysa rosa TaxID=992332 RepID=A0A9W7WHH5_TRIRA|nr:tetraspanin 36 [Triplophysa rosa]KAI7797733.1 vertebrate transmembrane 4 superfamily-like [Triplophysa rosa]